MSGPHLHPSYEYFLTTISSEWDTALDILEKFHAEMLLLVNDFWPRLNHFILRDEITMQNVCTRYTFANFSSAASHFFAFASAAEYETASFHSALSRAHGAVDGFVTSGSA